MATIHVATEDELSEAVACRLVKEAAPRFDVNLRFRKSGNAYLRNSMDKFIEIARLVPLLLITDLDNGICAPALITNWLRNRGRPGNLLFRVASREIEAWLLADHEGMRHLLAGGATRLPDTPDTVADPKAFLLKAAKKAPRDVKEDLLPEAGAIALQGLGYNARLVAFVRNTWQPMRAAHRSDSLNRTIIRLRELAERS